MTEMTAEEKLTLGYEDGQSALLDGANVQKCRSCGAPVFWVIMLPKQKAAPLNAELDHGGNVEVRKGKNSDELYGKVTGPDEERRMFLSHFATCPQADDWRKK